MDRLAQRTNRCGKEVTCFRQNKKYKSSDLLTGSLLLSVVSI